MPRYEVLERIGAGGMAEIFRGRAIAAGGFEKPVAIKRILPHLSRDERFVELLISEAKILASLRHRNIVQIYDVGLAQDGQYFLVMEYVDGADLRELVEYLERSQQRLPLDVVLHLGAEVCEALEHAHRATDAGGNELALVHRDVSPSNILLSLSGEVKLTDFGIAKSIEEETGHGGVRGKYAYISPEQAYNRHLDGRSDAFSLATILFELITGRRWNAAASDFDALLVARSPRTVRLRDVIPSVPARLDDIITRALASEPAQRFATAGELGQALRSYRYQMDDTSQDPAKTIAEFVRAVWTDRTPDDDERTRLVGAALADDFADTTTVFGGGSGFDDEDTRAISILDEDQGPITLSTRVRDLASTSGVEARSGELGEAEPGGADGSPPAPSAAATRPATAEARMATALPWSGVAGASRFPLLRNTNLSRSALYGLFLLAVVVASAAFLVAMNLLKGRTSSAADDAGAGDAGVLLPGVAAAEATPDAGPPDAGPKRRHRSRRHRTRRSRRHKRRHGKVRKHRKAPVKQRR